MEELTTAIQSLGRDDLLALRREINARLCAIAHFVPDIDADGIVAATESITRTDVSSRLKDSDTSRARMVIALRLHLAGMQLAAISRYVHRKRPDVYYLIDRAQFAVDHPRAFPELAATWNELIKIYPL